MARAWRYYRLLWLVVGVVLGLSVAGYWPQSPLYAAATDRVDTVLMATGPLDTNVEALWILDCLTGDLKMTVVGRTARFQALFTCNVLNDFGVDLTKHPKFSMVTGLVDIRPMGGANARPAPSVLYVAETTTGKVVAYTVAWQPGCLNIGRPIRGAVVPMDKFQFRELDIRRDDAGPAIGK